MVIKFKVLMLSMQLEYLLSRPIAVKILRFLNENNMSSSVSKIQYDMIGSDVTHSVYMSFYDNINILDELGFVVTKKSGREKLVKLTISGKTFAGHLERLNNMLKRKRRGK